MAPLSDAGDDFRRKLPNQTTRNPNFTDGVLTSAAR